MAEGSTEVKAEAINVLVRDQAGHEVHFKVKPHTQFSKIIDAYASKKAIDVKFVRFVFDGKRVAGTSTPSDVSADDGSQDSVIERK
ncbi:hypothetical protein FOA52_014114 [Chlamydomonas sp. UWO 241]|nr:hypothetical protein FOA52_014114 [Chlamydomonas sp. UWO 241]